MKYTPKPHQSKAIESVFSHANGLDNNTRTQMLMACGTGKTYTIMD
jgi:predicted helicase